jgi:hypothetical protein
MEIIIAGKACRANNQRAFSKLKSFVKANPIAEDLNEYDVRKLLLPFVHEHLCTNEWILYDGNVVWDINRLEKHFKTFVKFYDYKHFTNYLYEFFHLQCGSIAHYSKIGWFETYPTLDSLKEFFKRNEYGSPVRDYPPGWHYDARLAANIMATLFNY